MSHNKLSYTPLGKTRAFLIGSTEISLNSELCCVVVPNQMNFEMKTNREKASGPVCLPPDQYGPHSLIQEVARKNYEKSVKITWALGIKRCEGDL